MCCTEHDVTNLLHQQRGRRLSARVGPSLHSAASTDGHVLYKGTTTMSMRRPGAASSSVSLLYVASIPSASGKGPVGRCGPEGGAPTRAPGARPFNFPCSWVTNASTATLSPFWATPRPPLPPRTPPPRARMDLWGPVGPCGVLCGSCGALWGGVLWGAMWVDPVGSCVGPVGSCALCWCVRACVRASVRACVRACCVCCVCVMCAVCAVCDVCDVCVLCAVCCV